MFIVRKFSESETIVNDKMLRRIEAKLDALLDKAGIDSAKFEQAPPALRRRTLTAAEQQAIDNAPKPTPVQEPERGPRVTVTNAPSVASSVPPNAVGSVTVEKKEPSGKGS